MKKVPQRPTNLNQWLEHEVTQAIVDDQVRVPCTAAKAPPVYWAFFGEEHGQAWRDADGACWFAPEDGMRVLLHNTDRAALQLWGKVDLADCQATLDRRQGGFTQMVLRRTMEAA